jgi:hypothetical protein
MRTDYRSGNAEGGMRKSEGGMRKSEGEKKKVRKWEGEKVERSGKSEGGLRPVGAYAYAPAGMRKERRWEVGKVGS